mmetsp:Transcript_4901/g.12191  ORF Transcript_4901/g.12191 Transcript_4901/m.12191 type:complete len:273 (+) Transcript_4901:824-1642(+)
MFILFLALFPFQRLVIFVLLVRAGLILRHRFLIRRTCSGGGFQQQHSSFHFPRLCLQFRHLFVRAAEQSHTMVESGKDADEAPQPQCGEQAPEAARPARRARSFLLAENQLELDRPRHGNDDQIDPMPEEREPRVQLAVEVVSAHRAFRVRAQREFGEEEGENRLGQQAHVVSPAESGRCKNPERDHRRFRRRRILQLRPPLQLAGGGGTSLLLNFVGVPQRKSLRVPHVVRERVFARKRERRVHLLGGENREKVQRDQAQNHRLERWVAQY